MIPSCTSVILASLLLFNFVGPRDVTSAFPWHPNKLCFVVFFPVLFYPLPPTNCTKRNGNTKYKMPLVVCNFM